MKRTLLIAAALAVAVSTASGAASSRPSADSAAAVAPFVGADTFLVIRGDVSKFDVRATFAKADELARRMMKDDYHPKERRELEEAQRETSRWVSEFTRAGGREIYLVLGLADMDRGPFLVVPTTDRTDTEAIGNLLTIGHTRPPARDPATPRTSPGGPFPTCRKIRGAMVAGPPSTLRRLETMQPVPRPELAKAFEATQGSLIQLALLAPPAIKAMLAQPDVKLPPEMGIRSPAELADGFSWAAAKVEGPPRMSIDLVIQATDGAAARALGDAVDNLFRWTEKTKPGLLFGAFPDLHGMLAMFRPTVSGDRLTLSLPISSIDELLTIHLPPVLAEARTLAKLTVSSTRVKGILNAIALYATAATGMPSTWPKDLETLVEVNYITRATLKNPCDPSRSVGYGYIRPRADPPANRLIVYELHQDWTRGVAVAFGDGHVERIKDREKFKRLLDEARRHAAKE